MITCFLTLPDRFPDKKTSGFSVLRLPYAGFGTVLWGKGKAVLVGNGAVRGSAARCVWVGGTVATGHRFAVNGSAACRHWVGRWPESAIPDRFHVLDVVFLRLGNVRNLGLDTPFC